MAKKKNRRLIASKRKEDRVPFRDLSPGRKALRVLKIMLYVVLVLFGLLTLAAIIMMLVGFGEAFAILYHFFTGR